MTPTPSPPAEAEVVARLERHEAIFRQQREYSITAGALADDLADAIATIRTLTTAREQVERERDEAEELIGRCILKLPAGERGGEEGDLDLAKGIARLSKNRQAAEARATALEETLREIVAVGKHGDTIYVTGSDMGTPGGASGMLDRTWLSKEAQIAARALAPQEPK